MSEPINIPDSPMSLTFYGSVGNPVIVIGADCSLTLDASMTATEQARVFWGAVRQMMPSNRTCATCKHWEAPTRTAYAKSLGSTEAPMAVHGTCTKLDTTSQSDLIYIEAEGYEVDCVRTHPEFGCILWEAK